MNRRDRLAVLEAKRAAASVRDPGPDASDFERLVYRIHRTAATAGHPLTQQQAIATAQRLEQTLAAMDAIETGTAP